MRVGLLPERIEPFGAQDRAEHGETHSTALVFPDLFWPRSSSRPSRATNLVVTSYSQTFWIPIRSRAMRLRRGGQPVGVVLGAEQRLDARAHGYGS